MLRHLFTKLILIFLLFTPMTSKGEILVELSNKKLPIFNMPLLKDNENLYLIEQDPINKIAYIGHKSCFVFKIFALTNNKELFLNPDDINNLVETSYDYANIFCPKTNKIYLTAATSIELEKQDIIFKTTLIQNNGWQEEVENRQNFVLNNEKDRINTVKKDLEGKTNQERLAYLLGAKKLDNIYLKALQSYQKSTPENISIMVLIDDITSSHSISSYPIPAIVKGLPQTVGYYIINGTISSQKGQENLLDNTITATQFIKCKKKGCADLSNIDNIIKGNNR